MVVRAWLKWLEAEWDKLPEARKKKLLDRTKREFDRLLDRDRRGKG